MITTPYRGEQGMCKRIKDGDEGADRCGGRERPTRTKARRAKGERDEKRRNEEKEEWREYGENQIGRAHV